MAKKIIIAEDDEDMVFMYRLLFKGYDAEVDYVPDGRSLVDKVRAGGYSLVLTDNGMPFMDGLDAIKEIRTFNKEVPIYMVSGNRDAESKALTEGANGFIYKPLSKNTIDSLLKQYFL